MKIRINLKHFIYFLSFSLFIISCGNFGINSNNKDKQKNSTHGYTPTPMLSDFEKNWKFQELNNNEIELIKYIGISTEISIPSNYLQFSITIIGNSTFRENHNIKHIIIPDSVYWIGDYAFLGCSNLLSIQIPKKIKHIGLSAFNGCKRLTNITLPNQLISILDGTFFSCYNLRNITFPNKIDSISRFSFYNCTSLESLIIPKDVTYIGEKCFSNCSNLLSIQFINANCRFKNNVFQNVHYNFKIIAPIGGTIQQYCLENKIPFNSL